MALFSKVTQTVDSIVADINAKISDLHIVADAKKVEAAVHDEVVKLRTELSAAATAEAARAKRLAEKFKELIA